MAIVNENKIVRFDEYCKKCKHCDKGEDESPCYECLDNPVNEWSRKPLYFEDKN